MARTSNVFARVEPEIKEQAEQVLDQLGIPMSSAVGMFLRQVVLHQGIPFEIKLQKKAPPRPQHRDRPRGAPPQPRKNQPKDSTEQASLMKPYYLDIGR